MRELVLAKKKSTKKLIAIDGENFDTAKISKSAQSQLENLKFVDEQIMQKNNELQIADSARIVYASVLKSELVKIKR